MLNLELGVSINDRLAFVVDFRSRITIPSVGKKELAMPEIQIVAAGRSNVIRGFGFWSAILSAAFYLAFDIAEAMNLSGAIKSPFWITITVFLPSLFLALTFVVLVRSLHYAVPPERRFWTSLAIGFANIYATLNCFIYIIQVLVIAPSFARGTFAQLSLFGMSQDNPLTAGSTPLVAVNALAYALMSASTFFASFAIAGSGLSAWTRTMLRIHGIVAPTVVLALLWPPLIVISASVGFTYLIAAVLLGLMFRRGFE